MNGEGSADMAHSPAMNLSTKCPTLDIHLGSQLQGPPPPAEDKGPGGQWEELLIQGAMLYLSSRVWARQGVLVGTTSSVFPFAG